MLDKVFQESQRIMYIGDKENSNADSTLVSTKRSLIFNELNKELYKKFFLTVDELQAIREGYIYIHDMSARRDTMNCCLFDVANVLKGGFEMGNLWYNEPKSLDVAFDVIGDIVMAAASQQYGGFTVPEVDKLSTKEYISLANNYYNNFNYYPNLEFVAYSTVELMVSKYCPLKVANQCGKCHKNKYIIKDDFDEFNIYTDNNCHMHLLTSKKLKKEMKHLLLIFLAFVVSHYHLLNPT